MQQKTLNVQGMSCGACANKVEGNVSKISGVESVKVLLSDGKVDVSYNDNDVKLEEIKNTIEDTGYKVRDESEKAGSSCSCCQ